MSNPTDQLSSEQAAIEDLRDFVRDWISEWEATWVDPDEESHEWSALYRRAKSLISTSTEGPDHGS